MNPKSIHDQDNPELITLYEIINLPKSHTNLQDYFNDVMTILSDHFSFKYSAIISNDLDNNSLHLEAIYGIRKEAHPQSSPLRKGVILNVIESCEPSVILNLEEEPFYEDFLKGSKRFERIETPLLCIPLISENESIGVINIQPIYGSKNEFISDFQFLTILSAIISPVIKGFKIKRRESISSSPKAKSKAFVLEEVLEERLTEVLNRIDPYVEVKGKMGLLDDIISVVEKILIKTALKKVDYVQTSASLLLGINRNTLRKKMKELKIKCR